MLGRSRMRGMGRVGSARYIAFHWHPTPIPSMEKTQAHADALLGRWTRWQLQQELSHCHAASVFFRRHRFRLLSEGCYCSWAKKNPKQIHFDISVPFYFPKMKWEAHSVKKGGEPHIMAGDIGCKEQHWHPSLRYHRRAANKMLLFKNCLRF